MAAPRAKSSLTRFRLWPRSMPVRLAGDGLDRCRQPVSADLTQVLARLGGQDCRRGAVVAISEAPISVRSSGPASRSTACRDTE